MKGNTVKLEDLKKTIKPNPREVWQLDDTKVLLERKQEEAIQNKPRYVLIVSSTNLTKNHHLNSFNVVPFSNCDETNELAFPIEKKYEYLSAGFIPTKESHAILHYYQPIRRECFNNMCGLLDEQTYIAIREAVCMQVLGYNEFFDLEAD